MGLSGRSNLVSAIVRLSVPPKSEMLEESLRQNIIVAVSLFRLAIVV